MMTLAWRTLAVRKVRLLMTSAAIVLGVAFITGTLVLTDTSTKLFEDRFARESGRVDVVVRDAATSSSSMGPEVEREPVPSEVITRILRVEGVADARGIAVGSAPVLVDGRPLATGDQAVGISWAEAPFGPFRILSGRAPQGPGEVVLDHANASAAGVGTGERVTVSTPGGGRSFSVVGTAGLGESPGIEGSTVALFSPETAQSLFGLGTSWSEIHVVAGGIPAEELEQRLQAALGSDLSVASTGDISAARAQDARRQMRFVTVLLAVLGATSFVVGGFTIANTFSILVAQRTREFGTLRALGATPRQIRTTVVVEALVVGVLSSGAGTALGIGAASGLRELARLFGVEVPDGPLSVLPRTPAFGLLTGTAITVLGALPPARRAGRVSPVAAMGDGETSLRPPSLRRNAAGAGLFALAATLLATGAVLRSVALAGAGGVASLGASVLLLPKVAGRVAGSIGRRMGRRDVASLLAGENMRRTARRTAATSGALAVGLAVVTFLTVLASSAKQAIGEGIDEVIRADFVVQSFRGEMGGLPPQVRMEVDRVSGVRVTSPTRHGHWKTGAGLPRPLTAVDPATLPRVAKLDLVSGDFAGISRGGIVVAENAAAEQGVSVGDRLEMTFPRTGTQFLEVVGILDKRDAWAIRTDYLISLDAFGQHFDGKVDATVFVSIAEGADAASVRNGLGKALEKFPTATVHDQADTKAQEMQAFDSMLGLVTVLLLLAIGVALLGITNSLGLSIVERTREIGMLRAVGMTRRQAGRMIRMEAAMTALIGGGAGILLGVGIAAGMVPALAETKVIDLSLPFSRLIFYLIAAVLGGVLAGVIPGRKAARLNVLSDWGKA